MTHPAQPKASPFINGEHVEDTKGAEMPVIYAATGEQIATVHAATPEIVEMALASAKAAQKKWAAMTGTERGRVLRRAADIMRTRNRELSVLETYDTGKPLSETLYADATSGADALEYFGGLAASLTGEHIPMGQDWVYTVREPLGLCDWSSDVCSSDLALRRHRRLELPDPDRLLERRPGAGLRQCDGVQTV